MNHCRKHLLSEQASFNPLTRFVELDKIWRRTGFAMSTKGPSFRPDTPYNIGEGQIPAVELHCAESGMASQTTGLIELACPDMNKEKVIVE